MDSTPDADPAADLLALARDLRVQLQRHVALGAWAAPGGPSARERSDAPAGIDGEPAAAELAIPAPVAALAAPSSEVAVRAPEASPAGGTARASATAGGGTASTFPAVGAASAVPAGGAASAVQAGGAASAVQAVGAAALVAAVGAASASPAAVGAASAVAAVGAASAVAAVGGPASLFAEADAAPPIALGRRSLAQVREELGECTRCKLHRTRRSIVFGVGAEDTPLMFVGEAPGEQEDRRGEPFVGPAGELLDRMIEAMGWTRGTVYIANTTKCRPPNNRNPQPDELAQCTPFLDAQIRAIAPRIIVTLGRPAANHVLGNDAPISALRGRFHDRQGVKVMPTFHPAYLLRDPDKKRDVWSDLKQVIAELARLGIASPNPPRG